ncbi:MAG: hypothetical protein HUN04_15475 [Desulfobacter sp.]|nr:MAG: hypothetical protein HUN04_15475 [Desulfobacter sp.]
MKTTRTLYLAVTALVLGLCINLSAAFAASPEEVAVDFSKAFFMQDPGMEAFLSEEAKVTEDDKNTMEVYFDRLEKRAVKEGYKTSYYRMCLSDIKTEVLHSDDTTAKVLITGIKERNINSFYKIMADMFSLQDEHKLDEILTLVKEGGSWKIADGTYGLPR